MSQTSQNLRTMDNDQSAAMAAVLEARHGAFAADVAAFFASFHDQQGDAARSRAWGRVAETVRFREAERLSSSDFGLD